MVNQRQAHAADLELVGIVALGCRIPQLPRQILQPHMQQFGLLFDRPAQPLLKLRRAVDALRNPLVVIVIDHLLVDQQIAPARLVLQLLQVFDQLPVVPPERGSRIEIPLHQRGTDKNLPRNFRLYRTEIDFAPGNERDAEQHHLFVSGDLPATFLPVRFRIVALHQVAGRRLRPLGPDCAQGAGIELRRLHQFRGHDPFRLTFEQARTGEDQKPAVAATQIFAFTAACANADVAEQSGQQRAVNLIVSGRGAVLPVTHLMHLDAQLLMYVVPLLNPVPGEKIVAAEALKLALAEMAPLRLQIAPEF